MNERMLDPIASNRTNMEQRLQMAIRDVFDISTFSFQKCFSRFKFQFLTEARDAS